MRPFLSLNLCFKKPWLRGLLGAFLFSMGGISESPAAPPHPPRVHVNHAEDVWTITLFTSQKPQVYLKSLSKGRFVLQGIHKNKGLSESLKRLHSLLPPSIHIKKRKRGDWEMTTPVSANVRLKIQKKALVIDVQDASFQPQPDPISQATLPEPTPEPPPLKTVGHWDDHNKHAVLDLRTPHAVRIAVYERSGFHWVVLDTPYPVEIQPEGQDKAQGVRDIRVLRQNSLTLLQITLDPTYTLDPLWTTEGWRLTVVPYRAERSSPPYPWARNLQRTLIALKAPDLSICAFQDPLIRDPCVALVSKDPRAYQVQAFSCIAFETPKTSQGYVFHLKDSQTSIQSTPEGIQIRHPYGSPVEGARNDETSVVQQASYPLIIRFPESPLKGEVWSQERAQKQNAILHNSGPARERTRLDLALFYLTTFHYVESLNILRTLEAESSMIAIDPRFRAIRGMTLCLLNRYESGLKDLSSPTLSHIPETAAWKALCHHQLHPQDTLLMPWEDVYQQLKHYPRYAFEKIVFTIAQHAHQRGQFTLIQSFLEGLEGNYDAAYKTLYHDLMGYDAFYSKRYAQAFELWKANAEETPLPYRGMTQVADIMRQWNGYQAQPQEAIQALEASRPFLIHEPLMRPMLETLAQLYERMGSYAPAVMVWRELAEKYGLSDYTTPLYQALDHLLQDKDTFQKKPLKVVSVFEGCLPLISLQDMTGRALVMAGIQRLKELSLFDRASQVLASVQEPISEPALKIPYMIEAAELLFKRKLYEEALAQIQACWGEETHLMPQDKEKLFLLQAYTLKAQGQFNQAEQTLIQGHGYPEVMQALATFYLEQERWPEAFAAYQKILGQSKTDPHNPTWQRTVLNITLVAFHARDPHLRQWVHTTLKDAVQGTSLEETFRLLTDDAYQGAIDPQLLTLH